MKKSVWEEIGSMFLWFWNLKTLPVLILLIIVGYGIFALSWGANVLTKNDKEYIKSSDYNAYVEKIAKEHADSEIFEVIGDPINGPADDTVTLRYTFKKVLTTEEYEAYAQIELKYLYAIFKDFKLKKDALLAKSGKDFNLVFYTYEKGQKKEIGHATMFYIFGSLDGDNYIENGDKIMYEEKKY